MEPLQEPVMEPLQEPVMEPLQEPVMEPLQEPVMEPLQGAEQPRGSVNALRDSVLETDTQAEGDVPMRELFAQQAGQPMDDNGSLLLRPR
jgi:hypothetical protein